MIFIQRMTGCETDRVLKWTWHGMMEKTDLELMKECSYSPRLSMAEDNTTFISGGWVRFINFMPIEMHCLN